MIMDWLDRIERGDGASKLLDLELEVAIPSLQREIVVTDPVVETVKGNCPLAGGKRPKQINLEG